MKENLIVMFAIMLTAMSAQAQEVKKNSVGEAEKVEVVVKVDHSKDEERRAATMAFVGKQFSDLEMADTNGTIHKLSE